MRLLGSLIISFVITNWIYQEAVLFYPPLGKVGTQVAQVVRIPTHNEWPELEEKHFSEIRQNLQNQTLLEVLHSESIRIANGIEKPFRKSRKKTVVANKRPAPVHPQRLFYNASYVDASVYRGGQPRMMLARF